MFGTWIRTTTIHKPIITTWVEQLMLISNTSCLVKRSPNVEGNWRVASNLFRCAKPRGCGHDGIHPDKPLLRLGSREVLGSILMLTITKPFYRLQNYVGAKTI